MKQVMAILLVFTCVVVPASMVYGSEMDSLLRILEKKGYISHEEADEVLKEMMKEEQPNKAVEKGGAITGADREIIKEEVQNTLPRWVHAMKWHGDLRIRHDTQWFDRTGPIANRDRERFRARFGFTYEVNDLTQMGITLASGTSDQITTNQTMGGAFETKGILLDRAYVKHRFFDDSVIVYAGKFNNPFTPTTWLVFDPDLRPEGIAAQVSHALGDSTSVFLNAGAFPIDEVKLDTTDPWLTGVQGGIRYDNKDAFGLVLAVAHYLYSDVEHVSVNNYSGNTQNSFKLWNPTVALSAYGLPVYVGLTMDYVYNDDAREDNSGYLVEVQVGHAKIKKFKDWQVFATYSRLESNANYDEFPDSDFHSGGTNNKGYTVGYKIGLGTGWEHHLKYYMTKAVKGEKMDEDRIQVDLNYKF